MKIHNVDQAFFKFVIRVLSVQLCVTTVRHILQEGRDSYNNIAPVLEFQNMTAEAVSEPIVCIQQTPT